MSERVYNHHVEHLPEKPAEIEFLTGREGPEDVDAFVIGGLSILGDAGYFSPVITIMLNDAKKNSGWCLSLNNPDAPKEPYYFDTQEKTHKGFEIPNCIEYFVAKIDPALASLETSPEKIDEIINYVLPHISDSGPPPPHPKNIMTSATKGKKSRGKAQNSQK